eukprot:TRINITY_DN76482_c0_g1_i1.p1 TRINITY_DN76482_c0_g1~~TRINITY_DN76482_c0_g1_i1.p1  ORF type:complete len:394 (-),score=59.58 TRINITY_DN76482_c0_g1_i1:123-1304(-)
MSQVSSFRRCLSMPYAIVGRSGHCFVFALGTFLVGSLTHAQDVMPLDVGVDATVPGDDSGAGSGDDWDQAAAEPRISADAFDQEVVARRAASQHEVMKQFMHNFARNLKYAVLADSKGDLPEAERQRLMHEIRPDSAPVDGNEVAFPSARLPATKTYAYDGPPHFRTAPRFRQRRSLSPPSLLNAPPRPFPAYARPVAGVPLNMQRTFVRGSTDHEDGDAEEDAVLAAAAGGAGPGSSHHRWSFPRSRLPSWRRQTTMEQQDVEDEEQEHDEPQRQVRNDPAVIQRPGYYQPEVTMAAPVSVADLGAFQTEDVEGNAGEPAAVARRDFWQTKRVGRRGRRHLTQQIVRDAMGRPMPLLFASAKSAAVQRTSSTGQCIVLMISLTIAIFGAVVQ